ncbi:MAG: phosphatidate cytidylyltransferase, partial [Pseudomonadota bacterium]|nr:phosphatidate cytidylyltransferase [Pseudomonadota bacterium]
MLAAMVVMSWLPFTMMEAVIGGAMVAILAQAGDLMESALKRNLGVKDSGTLIPGHGGFLDRFDGYLLTLPVMCLYMM